MSYQMNPEVRRMLDAAERRRQEQAEENRVEFFIVDGHTEIPDLEFETPKCPVCRLHTDCDDGWFHCYGCFITWKPNGYGHEAIRDV